MSPEWFDHLLAVKPLIKKKDTNSLLKKDFKKDFKKIFKNTWEGLGAFFQK